MCVGSRVHLVGASISFEKNFYRLPFTPSPIWFAVSVLDSSYSFCSDGGEWNWGKSPPPPRGGPEGAPPELAVRRPHGGIMGVDR
jgi:hypothetical protein